MTEQLGARFWVESAMSLVSGSLALLTVVRKDWIEEAFGVDPDLSSGAMEWGIVLLALALTVVFVTLARRERVRSRTVTA